MSEKPPYWVNSLDLPLTMDEHIDMSFAINKDEIHIVLGKSWTKTGSRLEKALREKFPGIPDGSEFIIDWTGRVK